MTIAIYTLTSELHDEQVVGAVTQEFLNSLDITYELQAGHHRRAFRLADIKSCRQRDYQTSAEPSRSSVWLPVMKRMLASP